MPVGLHHVLGHYPHNDIGAVGSPLRHAGTSSHTASGPAPGASTSGERCANALAPMPLRTKAAASPRARTFPRPKRPQKACRLRAHQHWLYMTNPTGSENVDNLPETASPGNKMMINWQIATLESTAARFHPIIRSPRRSRMIGSYYSRPCTQFFLDAGLEQ